MSLLLDALRRNQNKAQAQAAPIELADVPPAEAPAEAFTAASAEPPAEAHVASASHHQALELSLDPIEASHPEPAPAAPALQTSALPDLPELTELPALMEQPMTLATPEPAESVTEPAPAIPLASEAVVAPEPVPAPAEPAAAAVVPAPVNATPPQAEPTQASRPRPAPNAQETAKAMFDATGTAAQPSTGPRHDTTRARRLQWSLVIGLVLAALTWMGWQYWQSTQMPSLAPAGGVQPSTGEVQADVTVAPAAEDAASQTQTNAPAASASTPTPPPQGGQTGPATTPAKTPKATTGASTRAKAAAAAPVTSPTPARQVDSGLKPAQLVRSQTQQQLQNAWAALRQGDAARAQTLYQQVLTERPDDPDAALGLAVSLHRQRQHQAAWAAYQRSLQLWPDNETARTGMLAILSESDPDTAESRLQEWVQSRPRDAAAQAALGNLLGKQGRWAQALGPLMQAQSLAPNSAAYAYNLAVALDQARRYDEALQMYRLTLQLGSAGVPEPTLQRRIQELQGASAR